MHGSLINVFAHVNETQSILPCLPHNDVIIGVFLKWHFEYKSLYILGNVFLNKVVITLQDLIETPLYKDLNVTIHHQ